LKVREVFTFRGVWGALSAKNNPIHNSKLPAFPTQSSPIGGEPYMEVGVGLENILNIFRVDYVWRLTYLDSKSTIRGGVLLSARFKF
ncbi:MAG: carboxypeptidase-like regulatory domain-containing protein, partial [Mucinivorans sp.]